MSNEPEQSPITPSPSPAERPSLRISGRSIVWVGVILAVAISLVVAYTRSKLGPDKQNVFVRGLFDLVGEYAKLHDGKWPRSWDDLKTVPIEGKWYYPLDFEKAQETVDIDFAADPEVIARQMPNQFTAIKAKKPVLDYRSDPRVSILIETIRRELEEQKTKPKPEN